MRKLFLTLLMVAGTAQAQDTKNITNYASGQDVCLRFNDAGTLRQALCIEGTDGSTTIGASNFIGTNNNLGQLNVKGDGTDSYVSGWEGAIERWRWRSTGANNGMDFYYVPSAAAMMSIGPTGATTIGSATGSQAHVIQSGGVTDLTLKSSGALGRFYFNDGSTIRWELESQTNGSFHIFQAGVTDVFTITSAGQLTMGVQSGANSNTNFIYGQENPDSGSNPTSVLSLRNPSTTGTLSLGISTSPSFYSYIQSRQTGGTGKFTLILNPSGGLVNYGYTTDASTTGTVNALATPTSIIRLSASGAITLNGIAAPPHDGAFIYIHNDTGATLQLVSESGSATATNRIQTSTGVTQNITNSTAFGCFYSGSRWRCM